MKQVLVKVIGKVNCRAFTGTAPTGCSHPEVKRLNLDKLQRETEEVSSLDAKEMWTDRKIMTVKREIIEELNLY